ncbi:MAG: iron uptake transporter deferrochelatase/peroxidase subunit [Acidimicrobiales bacterium]
MSLTRRRFLGVAGAGVAGAATTVSVQACSSPTRADVVDDVVEFHGVHQAGIVTPAQDRVHFAAFDVTTDSRDDLIAMLRAWTDAASKMTRGLDVGEMGAMDGPYLAPPEDTGEAYGLRPARLTITVGFGPTLFETADGVDRFGLADRRPAALRTLPHFAGDQLDPLRSGGDVCVQACADDPQVAVHAVRNLARLAFGTAQVRWSQLGFGRTSSTSDRQVTPRNLFGFKDGTANVKAEEIAALDEFVWVAAEDDPAGAWLTGGSYLVARRINMHIETWDRTSLAEQEAVIGRDKKAGAPLSGGDEFAEVDLTRPGSGGAPLVPVTSHVAVAHPSNNGGTRLLRRGYNFTDGSTGLGRLDAGLFFLAYTRDPDRHFVPLQTNLAANDALNEYLEHTGSALFAVPRGVRADDPADFLGADLFR